MSQTSTASPVDVFVQVSALLTGFSAENVLAPGLDPVDLKTTIYDFAHARAGAALDALLAEYAKLSGGKPVCALSDDEQTSIGNALLGLGGQRQDPDVAATARAVSRAWYLGSWYQPFDNGPYKAGTQVVISDQAYISGLAWKAMQSHAMGNSTFTYGYWASDPPPLDQFNPPTQPDQCPDSGSGSGSDSGSASEGSAA